MNSIFIITAETGVSPISYWICDEDITEDSYFKCASSQCGHTSNEKKRVQS